MLMRSFEAENVAEAMKMARDELGDDAVILSTDSNKNGGVIVTFALDRPDEEVFSAEELTAPERRTLQQNSNVSEPVAPLRNSPQPFIERFDTGVPLMDAIADTLRYHAVPVDISKDILSYAEKIDLPSGSDISSLQSALIDLFHACLRFDPLPIQREGTRVILVGPPGAGKTITAAKLAAKMVVDNQPVRVISTDTRRAGGIDQLQAFTKILGIELETATSRSDLKSILNDFDPAERVIVDSAGCNPYDFQELKELGEFARISQIEPILICAAGTDGHEATEIASVFSFLDIERVIITRTDCARHYGSLLSIARTGDYAFSHATSSARAMGDMQAMDPFILAQLFTHYQRERVAA